MNERPAPRTDRRRTSSTSTARSSTSASRSRCRIGPPDDERIVFKGAISALEARLSRGSAARGRGLRRGQADEAAHDAPVEDVREQDRRRHRARRSPASTASAPTPTPTARPTTSSSSGTRATSPSCASAPRLIQAELWCEDDTLTSRRAATAPAPTVTLVQGNELLDVEIRADLAHQRTKVKVSGYDAAGARRHRRGGRRRRGHPARDRGRAAPARRSSSSAFGERVSHRVREVPLTGGEATAWAKAEMLRRARGFVHVVGVDRGTPDLVVGSSRGPRSGVGGAVRRRRLLRDARLPHLRPAATAHRTHFEAERRDRRDERLMISDPRPDGDARAPLRRLPGDRHRHRRPQDTSAASR